MICRIWSGRAGSSGAAEAYERVFGHEMLGVPGRLPGFRGGYLLRRDAEGRVEFVTLTLFDRLDDVRGFAGDDYERANVSPDGRAALDDVDERVRHYTVVTMPGGSR
jgi:heme-degrading monooxygenase HmoA